MHLDFASEYAERSDEDIRLLIKDRHNLVDEARNDLDVEVHRRQRSGFQQHVKEPEEPRVQVGGDEEEHEIVVHSRALLFPKICPRCLAPADAVVRISCLYGSWFQVVDLWHYLFSRYPVPFCRKCAGSVKLGRRVQTVFFVIASFGSIYVAGRFHSYRLAFVLTLLCSLAFGALAWRLLNLSKRWPPPGIDVLSPWSARDRRLQLMNPAYEKTFIVMNGAKRSRDERSAKASPR